MESKIAKSIDLKFDPVAVIWTDDMPMEALQLSETSSDCVMPMFAKAATERKVSVFDRSTAGCGSAYKALGFGEDYVNQYPFDVKYLWPLLTNGNEGWSEADAQIGMMEEGVKTGDVPEEFVTFFKKGESLAKTPEVARGSFNKLPKIETQSRYVVFKSIYDLREDERPEVISFIVNPNQLSALVSLANYDSIEGDRVIFPSFQAGCMATFLYPFNEARKEKPRAVIGLAELFARLELRDIIGDDVFSFTIPLEMFYEMESYVKESFLNKENWKALMIGRNEEEMGSDSELSPQNNH